MRARWPYGISPRGAAAGDVMTWGTLVRAAGIGEEANTEQKLEDWREKSNPPCRFPAIARGLTPAPVPAAPQHEIRGAHGRRQTDACFQPRPNCDLCVIDNGRP